MPKPQPSTGYDATRPKCIFLTNPEVLTDIVPFVYAIPDLNTLVSSCKTIAHHFYSEEFSSLLQFRGNVKTLRKLAASRFEGVIVNAESKNAITRAPALRRKIIGMHILRSLEPIHFPNLQYLSLQPVPSSRDNQPKIVVDLSCLLNLTQLKLDGCPDDTLDIIPPLYLQRLNYSGPSKEHNTLTRLLEKCVTLEEVALDQCQDHVIDFSRLPELRSYFGCLGKESAQRECVIDQWKMPKHGFETVTVAGSGWTPSLLRHIISDTIQRVSFYYMPITAVDLDWSKLTKLTHLCIESVGGLGDEMPTKMLKAPPNLIHLRLRGPDYNLRRHIKRVEWDFNSFHDLIHHPKLIHLHLGDCRLKVLDLSVYENIRTIFVDRVDVHDEMTMPENGDQVTITGWRIGCFDRRSRIVTKCWFEWWKKEEELRRAATPPPENLYKRERILARRR